MNEDLERRLGALRAHNLVPTARVRRGLRVENAAAPTATLYLYDDIGGYDGISAKDVANALREIPGKPVDVHINSGGGSIFEADAIHNALRRHDATVTGYIDGIAASAASY